MEIKLESISDNDLARINALTLADTKAEDVFTFSAKLIDDQPTAHNRVWTKEWQTANLESLIGIPFVNDHYDKHGHIAQQEQVVGRVFAAETIDNATFIKGFIPLTTPEGRDAKARVENGIYKGVSIGAETKDDIQDGINYVRPSDRDRVFHVAFAASPGCETCSVVATEECEPVNPKTEAIVEFATEQLTDLKTEYVRLSAFQLGTGISKGTYESVADGVDPKTLKALVADLRNLGPNEKQELEDTPDAALQLAEQIEKIREERGV